METKRYHVKRAKGYLSVLSDNPVMLLRPVGKGGSINIFVHEYLMTGGPAYRCSVLRSVLIIYIVYV